MRVALFFDGKNFYENLERARGGRHHLDYGQLAKWLVERVGGTRMTGAHYYTGVPDQLDPEIPEYRQLRGLIRFLDNLEYVEGFFVYRFPRIRRISRCSACGEYSSYTEEKEVDTTMVADMIRLAAGDAFDTLILASGDADHSPAVEAVRAMGKVVYLASWGDEALSPRLRRAAFGHIDLMRECPPEILGEDVRTTETAEDEVAETIEVPTLAIDSAMADKVLAEVGRAQHYFEEHGGYLGRGYFIHRWRGRDIPAEVGLREAVLDHLIECGRLEELQILGETALRVMEVVSTTTVVDISTQLEGAAALEPVRSRRTVPDLVAVEGGSTTSGAADVAWVRQTIDQHVRPDPDLFAAWDSLKRAEEHFRHRGFVGRGYFLTKWRDIHLHSDVGARERLLTRLIELGLVEQYSAEGTTALRTASTRQQA